MISQSDTNMLYLRGEYWNYKRKVPRKYKDIEPRTLIRVALGTKSLDIARLRRDALVEADNAYWSALLIESIENGGVTSATRTVQEKFYKSATVRALSYGFIYKTAQQLVSENAVDEVLERAELLSGKYTPGKKPPKRATVALLGGAAKPEYGDLRVSEVFEKYISEIAFDAQRKKSPSQRKSWEKSKRTGIAYFIEAVGDIEFGKINRSIAQSYRKWWFERIQNGDNHGIKPTPYTANRHIGNMSSLYREFYSYVGDEDRANPFRRLRFKEDRATKTKRPPFETDWIKNKILVPGLFQKVNIQARHILYTLIETGARPSEICNLRPENIRLEEKIPYLAIRESENREIKAEASDRDIPLVGISLAAMQLNPNGFPRYFDKETSLSAILMKSFKVRGLLPTDRHKVYSLRHSFEKRMLEAGLDNDLRYTLMGHKNERPEYGDGGSIEFRRNELLKIVLPYDGWSL